MSIKHEDFHINDKGHLEIGNIDTVNLAKKYGTPLYVYDVTKIRQNCQAFLQAFKKHNIKAQVAYASKAFSSIAMLQVIAEENLNLDVVSKGELYTAICANFPPERIHLHGNNKSAEEIQMALEYNVGCIVLDNENDLRILQQQIKKYKIKMDVLLRVTPGVYSETHEYMVTGNEDSKFGFNLSSGQIDDMFLQIKDHPYIHLKGLHCHIGSQIFETKYYTQAIERLFVKLQDWHDQYSYTPEVLNLGGGFGIQYTKEDPNVPYATFIDEMVTTVLNHVKKMNIPMPEIWIEPGRAIVGNAGITLYTIGAIKEIPNVRKYISVDGGMTDNLRPALYQAKYEAVIANKANQQATEQATIAGKCCESGDVLIWDLPLAPVETGDLLAVFSTGAYGYSMASHYNRFSKPAVVFVEKGKDQLVIKRESYKDVVRNDLPYKQ